MVGQRTDTYFSPSVATIASTRPDFTTNLAFISLSTWGKNTQRVRCTTQQPQLRQQRGTKGTADMLTTMGSPTLLHAGPPAK